MTDKERKRLVQKMYEYRDLQRTVAYFMKTALMFHSQNFGADCWLMLLEWAIAKDEKAEMLRNITPLEMEEMFRAEAGLV